MNNFFLYIKKGVYIWDRRKEEQFQTHSLTARSAWKIKTDVKLFYSQTQRPLLFSLSLPSINVVLIPELEKDSSSGATSLIIPAANPVLDPYVRATERSKGAHSSFYASVNAIKPLSQTNDF